MQEYRKFYAVGSGTDLALEAAAEFDDSTGLPVVLHSVMPKNRK